MPADLNRVTLVGRLTRDPELRHTGGGDPICSIRLAVSSRARDEGGNWGDRSNYFDVTVFGRQAQTAADYLAKGRRIGVDGRLSLARVAGPGRHQAPVGRGDRQRHLLPRLAGRGRRRGGQEGAGWSRSAGRRIRGRPAGERRAAAGGATAGSGAGDGDIPF